jgi:guanylate kinase
MSASAPAKSVLLPAFTNMPDSNKMSVRAPLIIVSGPSGSGKSTLIGRALRMRAWPLRLSVSATTRAIRPGERAGIDYFFLSSQQFEEEIRAGAFLEYAKVHDNYYGTLQREVEPYLRNGTGVILDIDVQGASQVRSKYPDNVSIFVRAGSIATYEQRLRARGTETEQAIERRVANARRELALAHEYDYQVVNDDLTEALTQIETIIDLVFKGDSNAR